MVEPSAEEPGVSVPALSHHFTYAERTLPVHVVLPSESVADAPPVLVLHELPGMTPETVRLAHIIADRGFTVYLPLFFGKPRDRAMISNTLKVIWSSDWHVTSGTSMGPIVEWTKALARDVSQRHDGARVGVVGQCLTGGFPIAMLSENVVVAGVVSQPSLPFGLTSGQRAAPGLAPEDFAAARRDDAALLGFRFEKDRISRRPRLQSMLNELSGVMTDREITSDEYAGPGWCLDRGAHSVLSGEYRNVPGHPSLVRVNETIELFERMLR